MKYRECQSNWHPLYMVHLVFSGCCRDSPCSIVCSELVVIHGNKLKIFRNDMTKPSSGEILTFVSIEASTFWNGYITYHHVTSPPFAEPPFLVQCPLFHDISKLYQIIPSLFVLLNPFLLLQFPSTSSNPQLIAGSNCECWKIIKKLKRINALSILII